MEYTQEQQAIFEFVKSGIGHGIIDAVAGAGKTTTIMEAARYVENKSGVLFCAFNKSIATEISERFIEKRMSSVTTKTMHALGLQILNSNNNSEKKFVLKNSKYADLLKNPEISKKLLKWGKKVVKYHGYKYDEFIELERQPFEIKSVLNRFSYRLSEINNKFRLTLCKDGFEDFKSMVIHYGIFKNNEIGNKNFDEEINAYLEAHRILIKAGNEFSERHKIIDFTDMLYLPYQWKFYPLKKFDFVFIDECQDLSRSQLAVALKYAKKESRILSVGDPRQSIYGFTGADIQSFNNIEKYTKAKRLPLTLCFRCPQKIIELAKGVRADILGNKNYDGVVEELLMSLVVEKAVPNDLIICRTKDPLLLLVFQFIEQNKKVKIHPDIAKSMIGQLRRLFKKEELLKNLKYEYDGFEGLRDAVFTRRESIIHKEAQRFFDVERRKQYIEDELSLLESELDFLNKRYEIWKEDCHCLEDIFKKIKLYVSEKINPIVISTIHSAKGLESDRVFILEYSKLPLKRDEQKDWEIIQEINLKYVAVTRAKEILYQVYSESLEEIEEEGSLFDDLFDID